MPNATVKCLTVEALKDLKIHPQALKELRSSTMGTGFEVEFFKDFYRKIRQLKEFGTDAINLKGFEKLSGVSDLYAMRMQSKAYNIRILYSYLKDGEILLHCFYEKEGKYKDSYEKHIPIAIKRKKEICDS